MTRTKLIGLLLVGLMVVSAVGAAAPADDINFDDDSDAPNPYIDVDTMTKASHPMEEGTSVSDIEGYFDDNGDWVTDTRWEVNDTMNKDSGDNVNPYTYDPAKVDDEDYGAFPRDGSDASAIRADNWTVDNSGGGTMTLGNTTVASGVDALSVAVTGQSTASDVVEGSYTNWEGELDSDEDKRVLQLAGEVNSINSDARINITVVDESGDYKEVWIEPDASSTTVNHTVIATGTGTFSDQVKLSDLTTTGSGSWDNIEEILVQVEDNTADFDLSRIDLEKRTKDKLGTENVDDDGDGTYDETNDIYNSTGTISVRDLGSLGSEYNDASIVDLQFAAKYPASDIKGSEGEEDAYVLAWDDASQYVGYDSIMNVTYRMNTTSAIDLSHSGMDLDWEQELPSDRYVEAGRAESVGSNGNLSDQSLNSPDLKSPGEVINLDGSVSSGTYYAVGYEVKFTEEEANAVQDTGDGGAAAPPDDGGDGGGIVGFITSIPGAFLSLVGGFFGLRWLRRRGSG